MLTTGESIPSLGPLPLIGGGTLDLASYAGDVVVVVFVSSDPLWQADCETLLGHLTALWTEFGSGGNGVQMVAVQHNDDGGGWIGTLNGGAGLPFPAIQDNPPANDIYHAFDDRVLWWGMPQIYVIDRDQIVHSSATYCYVDPIMIPIETQEQIENRIMDAIAERDPVTVEFVADVSGSMNSVPAGSSDPKLQLMKDAANIAANVLGDHGQTGDRAGLVSFSDVANDHGGTFHATLGNAASITGLIDPLIADGCTAMGAGLQTAFNMHVADGSPNDRHAILLTDGRQNIEPYVRTYIDSLFPFIAHSEILDDGGSGCSGIHSGTAGNPGHDLINYDTKVHTIGLGITGSYGWDLNMLSATTGGIYRATNDPNADLQLIYEVDLCEALAGGSPTVIHYNTGHYYQEKCRVVERFQVNSTIRKLTAILSWEHALNGDLTFWLRAPDGTLLDLHKEMRLFDSYAIAQIYLPNYKDGVKLPYIGEWEMIIGGVIDDNKAFYRASVIGEDPELKFSFDFPRNIYSVGDMVPLAVSLVADDYKLSEPMDIVLEHSVLRTPVAELLADYQANPKYISEPTNPDCDKCKPDPLGLKLESLSNDPLYKGKLLPVRRSYSLRDGTLDCKVEEKAIILPVILNQPGLNNYRITAKFKDREGGTVTRTSMVSVQVDPGRVDPKKSIVKPLQISTKRMEGVLVYVTPRNSAGQLIGPGLKEDDIEFKIGRSSVECQVEDDLNGSYRIKVPWGKKAAPKGKSASITIKGEPVWKGELEVCG
jgi:hypothetical protein